MKNDELIRKIHLIAAHTYAAFAFLYAGNFSLAKDFTELTKKTLEELISELREELKEEDFQK